MGNDVTADGSASGIVLTAPCGHFIIVESGVRVGRLIDLHNAFALKHAQCPRGSVQRTAYGYPVLTCSSG